MEFCKKYLWVYGLILAAVLAGSATLSALASGHSVLAMAEQPSAPVVVIDPGHGGEDGGALSCTGVRESELNLAVSLRLEALLSFIGQPTRILRTEDIALYTDEAQTLSQKKVSDLRHRAELVNQVPNAVLVSVHQNTFPESRYAGTQVFYAQTQGSKALAETIQSSAAAMLAPENHRQAKQSSQVYLLEHIHGPGVLVECGFLSNPAEEALLRSDTYQRKLACAIAQGIWDWLAGDGVT